MTDTSMREDLAAAFQEHENTNDTAVIDAPVKEWEHSENPEFTPDKPADRATRERDASGKFAPVVPAQGAEKQVPAGEQPKEVKPAEPAPAPGDTNFRAPASWTPEAREMWKDVPVRAQQEIARREMQVSEALRVSADARRVQQEMSQVFAPYADILQRENIQPLYAVQNLLQTAAHLRTGHPSEKAARVAGLIQQFGVPLDELNTHLTQMLNAGKLRETGGEAGLLHAIDQRLAPVQQFMQSQFAQRNQPQEQGYAQAQQELNAFMSNPANEFASDVTAEMASLLDIASQRGQVLSLDDAYKRAILMRPEVSSVIHRRTQMQQSEAAKRASAAASIAPMGGAPSQDVDTNGDGSLRSDILSAVATLQRKAR